MHKFNYSGFSLLELVVAITIFSILASLSINGYQHYIIRENRELAKQALAQSANKLQKYYAEYGRYTNSDGTAVAGLFESTLNFGGVNVYKISLSDRYLVNNAQEFLLIATPESLTIQANDDKLCINQNGQFATNQACQ
jgi:prepilin-type N-terminal cleavage/methylation domain-containing protein